MSLILFFTERISKEIDNIQDRYPYPAWVNRSLLVRSVTEDVIRLVKKEYFEKVCHPKSDATCIKHDVIVNLEDDVVCLLGLTEYIFTIYMPSNIQHTIAQMVIFENSAKLEFMRVEKAKKDKVLQWLNDPERIQEKRKKKAIKKAKSYADSRNPRNFKEYDVGAFPRQNRPDITVFSIIYVVIIYYILFIPRWLWGKLSSSDFPISFPTE